MDSIQKLYKPHLIEDEEDAVLVADLAQRRQEARGWREEAALSHDRFHNDGSRVLQARQDAGGK